MVPFDWLSDKSQVLKAGSYLMVDQKTLKQLIRLMVDNDLTELDLEGEGEKVKLKRGCAHLQLQQPTGPVTSIAALPASTVQAANAVNSNQTATGDLPVGTVTIDCPMVGTFYCAPSPDADPFVNIGDHIDASAVVCVIEAMKVFNEIKAEKNGTVQEMLVKNGEAVEFGQPLFLIKSD